jgi:two-component system OmpR family sensor kinase
MPESEISSPQGELESLSEAIASGLEPEALLALIAQRICQVLTISQAHIFLRQGESLLKTASYPAGKAAPHALKTPSGQRVEDWVTRHGRPFILNHRSDQPVRRAASTEAAPGGENHQVLGAAVPIWSARQVLGVLLILDDMSHSAMNGLLPLLSVLADLISLALENGRILAREERRSKLISLLQYMASELPDKMLKEVTQAIEERIGEVMGVQKVGVLLYQQETDELISLGTSETTLGRMQHELGLDHLALGKAGVLADVFRTGQPFLSNNLDTLSTFPAALKEHLGLKAAMVVPLEVEGERRGLITVMSTSADAFTDDDLPFLTLISIRLGHMLHHQELSKELAEAETERLARAERENFLLVVAHDLKNALTTIRGNAQLAVRRVARGDTTTSEQTLRLITTRAGQAIQLVNDMVDVSQMETGLFRLYMEPVELVELLQEELSVQQETSGEQYPIHFQSDFDQITVEADRNRLSQVVMNLLINAIRYSPQGGTIKVLLTQAPSEPATTSAAQEGAPSTSFPQTVMVMVNDQGIGVLPSERERIFERSFRGRGARFASGSGLGLYISREIIERHGGRLWVEPHAEQGSSFRFTLPTSRSSQAEAE